MSRIKENWEYYGKNDPYFAVVTFDEFRRENLTEANKEQFFQTGEEHIAKIWKEIEENFQTDFRPQHALDFGCGVGRLVVPLAKKCERVTGVDISEQMLKEAAFNCKNRNLDNTVFMQTEEFLAEKSSEFDFIHSFIVFQHINPEVGNKIIIEMVKRLKSGGIGVLHFTYFDPGSAFQSTKFKVYRDLPLIYTIKKMILGGEKEPLIPMYLYNLNLIFSVLQKNNCTKLFVRFSYHGYQGAVIFFQKEDAKILDF